MDILWISKVGRNNGPQTGIKMNLVKVESKLFEPTCFVEVDEKIEVVCLISNSDILVDHLEVGTGWLI